jgi:hypothetical protein
MTTDLIHPELGCREFGASLIRAESLIRLVAEKGWRLPPACRFEGFDLLHIESALNDLTVAQPAVSREAAVMLLAGSAAADHELAEKLPVWVLQAARGHVWRERIRALLAAGELRLADPISFEEIPATPAQAVAADAPVQAAPEHSGPAPLSSREMAGAFGGLCGRDAERWARVFSDSPKWLEPARVSRGLRGVTSARWDPLKFARLLTAKGEATDEAVSRMFRQRPELEAWRGAWLQTLQWPGL